MNWLDNQKHCVELLTDDYYTIGVQFYGTNQLYTYKVDKAMKVEVGNHVVVKPKGRYACAEVLTVQDHAEINFEASFSYSYIVQVVDSTAFDALNDRSTRIKDALVDLRKRNMKAEIVKEFAGQLTKDDLLKLESDFGIKI